ncbi:TPA: hypothetical protein ACISZ4_002934, partial [Salmonella enterica subsp. enterica serovar Chester]
KENKTPSLFSLVYHQPRHTPCQYKRSDDEKFTTLIPPPDIFTTLIPINEIFTIHISMTLRLVIYLV